MKYHPTIQKLDAAASEFHALGLMREKTETFRLAGALQQHLLKTSPFGNSTRFLDQQWVWALGHIGLTHQLIRWFRHTEPDTKLILECTGSANNHFLVQLQPYISIVPQLIDMTMGQAEIARAEDFVSRNAVYFGCPDGRHSIVDFYKMVERECEGEWLLKLSDEQKLRTATILLELGVKHPYVALQPRKMPHEPERNMSEQQMRAALSNYPDHDVVITGLDECTMKYPSVQSMPDPHEASFLLSAACDQFIGSNSGAWTIAHAYQRPVEIINDRERAAWIYQ